MIKVIVNLNCCIKRVALVSLSLPLGLHGVFLAQPKVTSHITSGSNRSLRPLGRSKARPLTKR